VRANNLDLYQVNCTFFDALGRRGNEYLIARAIQFFVPGIPQVYYVGLLAGTNDMELLARTQVGRDINRHYYTSLELQSALADPIVRPLLDLIRLRNTHPAFMGQAYVETSSIQTLAITWKSDGHWAKLDVDFAAPRALISYSTINTAQERVGRTWELLPYTAGSEESR
jgi:sucrose phosphorylase